MKRVAVTGLGVVSPIGHNAPEFWASLCAGRSGVRNLPHCDASRHKARIAAEVLDFQAPDWLDRKKSRRLDRFSLFALAAAKEAWTQAGLSRAHLDPYECGAIIGSSHGGEGTLVRAIEGLFGENGGRADPLLMPKVLGNMAAAQAAMAFDLRGPNFGVSSACATGAHAIGEATEVIRRGDAEIMLCGGAEACITPLTLAADAAAGALSLGNDKPARASRPFDRDRNGFVLGEGAAILVLEELSHAQARGARVYAELAAYAASCDAYHETAPRPEGASAAHAIRRALEKARIPPEKLDAVFAHAAGTPVGDRAEAQALKSALGEHSARVLVSATKSVTGHLLGASGALQAAACVLSLWRQALPPTINCDRVDVGVPLRCVRRAQAATLRHVLSNSFGFGGHNACLIFSKPES